MMSRINSLLIDNVAYKTTCFRRIKASSIWLKICYVIVDGMGIEELSSFLCASKFF